MAQKAKLPITAIDEKQSDEIGLTTFGRAQVNLVYTLGADSDGNPTLMCHKRPGLQSWANLNELVKVDGLYWWARQKKIIATCNGKTFFVNQDGTWINHTGTGTMIQGVRPTYADVDGTTLFQASSGKIGKYPTVGGGAYLTDLDAPEFCTHIATLNKTLIALRNNSERFDWANVAAPDTWDSKFASSEAATDLARGLFTANSEIYIPGETTLEIWRDTGTTFVRSLGAIQVGTNSPYSFAFYQGTAFWLSNNREVMILDPAGRTPKVISQPYARYLHNLSTINDAIGDFVQVDGKNFYILTFPIANKTIVYDILLDRWSEWATNGNRFIGNCYAMARDWGFTVVGDSSTGKLYKISESYQTDDTLPITTTLRTDVITHGSAEVPKFSNKLKFRFKRTKTTGTPTTMTIRYRDDGDITWKNTRTITIESTTNTDLLTEIRGLGRYFSRQYEITLGNNTDVALIEVEETFDYGR